MQIFTQKIRFRSIEMVSIILASILVQLVYCAGDINQQPSITSISTEQIRNVGDSVELNCTVDTDDYSVLWTKKDRDRPINDVVLSIGSQLTMKDSRLSLHISNDSKSYTLKITNIQPIDTALYECQIIVSTTNKITSHVELLVRTAPKISDTLSILPGPVPEGQDTELTCSVEGYPRPTVSWIREYDALMPAGGHSLKGNILKIASISRLDRGTYYCVAENGVGQPIRKMINLEVEFAPVISVQRPKVAQALNYDIELECRVEAYPAPAVIWYKDTKPISNGHDDYSISNTATENELTSSVLRIESIEKEQYGDYYCKANNKVGHAEARINVFESIISVSSWHAKKLR